jgi:hypothetical protein
MAGGGRSQKRPSAHTSDGHGSNWTVLGIVVIWLVGLVALLSLLLWPQDAKTQILLAVLATLPTALALTLTLVFRRDIGLLGDETKKMRAAILDLRHTLVHRQAQDDPVSPLAQSKLDALAAAQEQTDTRLTLFFSRRGRADAAIPLPAKDDREPLLALGDSVTVDPPAPNAAELIRALHFPEDENDAEGFEALRKALADSRTANLIRAAQEVLTHLAQEGIYMDDLRPDRARPEFWRAFAAGTRGTLIAPLGGIRDRSCLALTAARMRGNPEFKEAAHLFLREFDKVFAAFEKDADDAQVAALSETRSARAFMLLGRVSGVFSR